MKCKSRAGNRIAGLLLRKVCAALARRQFCSSGAATVAHGRGDRLCCVYIFLMPSGRADFASRCPTTGLTTPQRVNPDDIRGKHEDICKKGKRVREIWEKGGEDGGGGEESMFSISCFFFKGLSQQVRTHLILSEPAMLVNIFLKGLNLQIVQNLSKCKAEEKQYWSYDLMSYQQQPGGRKKVLCHNV